MLAVAPSLGQDLLALARKSDEGAAALTLLPGVLVARALADSSEAVRGIFARLWSVLRCRDWAVSPRAANLENLMELTPREKDKLLIFTAALLAERRKDAASSSTTRRRSRSCTRRSGRRARRQERLGLMGWGATLLKRDEVMEGVPEMIPEIQVEATFPMERSSSPCITRSHDSRRDEGRGRASSS
jgi:urease subunit gamma